MTDARGPDWADLPAPEGPGLLQVQKLAELGLTTAAVLHQLRQPLSGIKGFAQLVRDGAQDPAGLARQILREVARLEELLASHQHFLHPRATPGAHADLVAIARDALKLAEPRAARAGVSLRLSGPGEPVPVPAAPGSVLQIVVNLVANAVDATAEAGAFAPVEVAVRAGPDGAQVLVADSGRGIAPEVARRLFTPFCTSKGPDAGTGLGLYVSRKLAESCGATLALLPAHEAGVKATTVFRLRFAPGTEAAARKQAVLVVDDEEVVRTLLASLLEPEGLEVQTAASGTEALERVAERAWDLIITDKNLPGASGLEIARAAKQRDPGCAVMIITGYPSPETAEEGLEIGIADYLEKPFDDISLVRQRVRQVLAARPATPAPASGAPSREVLVVVPQAAHALRVGEAVKALGGTPILAATVDEGVAKARPDLAAVLLSLDLAGDALAPGKIAALRGGGHLPLVTLCASGSMGASLTSMHLGARKCVPLERSTAQDLAVKLAKYLPLTTGD